MSVKGVLGSQRALLALAGLMLVGGSAVGIVVSALKGRTSLDINVAVGIIFGLVFLLMAAGGQKKKLEEKRAEGNAGQSGSSS